MNTTAPRHRSAARATIVLLAATASLAGCAPEPPPPAERPNVVWQEGEPEGPLEDDPRVRAARAHDLELSIGYATRDFTSSRWSEVAVGAEIWRQAQHAKDNVAQGDLLFPPGPTPMIAIYIDERPDGGAKVLMCKAAPWTLTASDSGPEFPLNGWFSWYTVVKENGNFKVDHIGSGEVEGSKIVAGEKVIEPFLADREDSDCDLADAKIGLFDPPPDPALEYGPEDLKLPGSPE